MPDRSDRAKAAHDAVASARAVEALLALPTFTDDDERDALEKVLAASLYDRGNYVQEWPADEAEAYREHRWEEGRTDARTVMFRKAADTVIASGYRLPQPADSSAPYAPLTATARERTAFDAGVASMSPVTVTTREDGDALPVGSIIRAVADGEVCYKFSVGDDDSTGRWAAYGRGTKNLFPATVLFRPATGKVEQ